VEGAPFFTMIANIAMRNDDMTAKIGTFLEYIQKIPRAELGGLVKEYLAESYHGGMDGFSPRDLSGIGNFLEDMQRYHENLEPKEHNELASLITNVNPVA
jgi:hypothetical protein